MNLSWRRAPAINFWQGQAKDVSLSSSVRNPGKATLTFELVRGTLPIGVTGPTGPRGVLRWLGQGADNGVTAVVFRVTGGGQSIDSPAGQIKIAGTVVAPPPSIVPISASDELTLNMTASALITIIVGAPPDVTPPSVPTGTLGTPTSTTIPMTWTTPLDTAVPPAPASGWAFTKIYMNGVALPLIAAPQTAYTATNLTPGTPYSFQWASIDVAGNESAKSSPPKTATTAAAGGGLWLAHSPKNNGGQSIIPIFSNIVGDGTDSVGGTGRVSSILGGNNVGTTPSILLVNSLSPTGSISQVATGIWRGSLRAGIATNTIPAGPISVLFEVGGLCDCLAPGDIGVTRPNVTIYGHTAPAQGFYIHGAAIWVQHTHFSMEGLHFLVGDDATAVPPGANLNNRGAIKATGQNVAGGITGLVFDHNSFYWGCDETIDSFTNIDQLTFSNNIVAETLHPLPPPADGRSGGGMIIYGNGNGPTKGKTVFGNFYAQNYARNTLNYVPYVRHDCNVVYNWGNSALQLADNFTEYLQYYAAIRNNVAIRGLTSPKTHNEYMVIWSTLPSDAHFPAPGTPGFDVRVFLSGNACIDSYTASPQTLANQWQINWDSVNSQAAFEVTTNPLIDIGIVLTPTAQVVEAVLQGAGAYSNNRDTKDARVVSQCRSNTGTLQPTKAAFGGMPTIQTGTFDHLANGMPTGATARAMNTIHPKYGGQGRTNFECYCLDFRDAKVKY